LPISTSKHYFGFLLSLNTRLRGARNRNTSAGFSRATQRKAAALFDAAVPIDIDGKAAYKHKRKPLCVPWLPHQGR
jgi:hypothetical protein